MAFVTSPADLPDGHALIPRSGRSIAVATGEVRGRDDARVYATGTTTCRVMRPA